MTSNEVKHRNSNIPINKDTTFILKIEVPDNKCQRLQSQGGFTAALPRVKPVINSEGFSIGKTVP